MRQYRFAILKKTSFLFLSLLFHLMLTQGLSAQEKPERVILFLIDGLHYEAHERVEMENLTSLIKQGTYIEKASAIMLYHPRHGAYATVHTSSFPNPVLMAGTIFLEKGQKMIQDQFNNTAFVANTRSYQTVTPGFDFVIQKSARDQFSVDQALNILENNSIDFMRVHLQNAGSGGHESVRAEEGQPFRYNIWNEESPYVKGLKEADYQLGRFIEALKAMDKWEGTLFILSSDHGQTKTGWHPVIPEESWLTPLIFVGPGIKKDQRFEWADHIDIAPTITHLMDVEAPNTDGGAGRVLDFISEGQSTSSDPSFSKLFEVNKIIARYIIVKARLLSKSQEYPYLNAVVMEAENSFYGLERIMEWPVMGNIEAMNKHNLEVVNRLEKLYDENL